MSSVRVAALLFFSFLLSVPLSAQIAAPEAPGYSRRNSFGIFGEYSNDSSHILVGVASNRKLLATGFSYSHRLLLTPTLDLQYLVELRPVLFVSNPLVHEVTTVNLLGETMSFPMDYTQSAPCQPSTSTHTYPVPPPGSGTYTATFTYTCGTRQWTFGEGLDPLGVKLSLLRRHRLQPVFTLVAGYLFSTRPIPIQTSGSFNYTFAVGAGLELYQSAERSTSFFGNRSLRAEYRVNHISNAYAAAQNPGIDNGLVQITYAFGR